MAKNYRIQLTSRQIEEAAKLSLDLGKLTFGSLILGLFQVKLNPLTLISVSLSGISISFALFLIGLSLFKEVDNG